MPQGQTDRLHCETSMCSVFSPFNERGFSHEYLCEKIIKIRLQIATIISSDLFIINKFIINEIGAIYYAY